MAKSVGMPLADEDRGAPLGEPRAELTVVREPLAEPVESLGDRLAGEHRQRLRARVHLDARDDAHRGEQLGERRAVGRRLPDRLVEQDHAADVLGQPRRREEHLTVRAPVVLRGVEPDRVEPLLDRAGALVGREDALARCDQLRRGRAEYVGVHLMPPVGGFSVACGSGSLRAAGAARHERPEVRQVGVRVAERAARAAEDGADRRPSGRPRVRAVGPTDQREPRGRPRPTRRASRASAR